MAPTGRIFEVGAAVALRWVYGGKLLGAHAAGMVADEPTRTLLAWWPGCQWRAARLPRHPAAERWEAVQRGTWDLEERAWTGSRVLVMLEPDRYYSMSLFWDASTGEFRNYYVNFQLPYRRSSVGFDSLDLDLDVVVQPDLSWTWKDEADWEAAKASGALDAAATAAVEAAKLEAVERIEAGLGELTEWRGWRPSPEWPAPQLPPQWDRIP